MYNLVGAYKDSDSGKIFSPGFLYVFFKKSLKI